MATFESHHRVAPASSGSIASTARTAISSAIVEEKGPSFVAPATVTSLTVPPDRWNWNIAAKPIRAAAFAIPGCSDPSEYITIFLNFYTQKNEYSSCPSFHT
ncbi:hypothetical protein FBU31_001924 [Coemansia sp. 'formosensis']|nr:hypothetical protein FBU31_001924 [Coemansia sp. 'formosensis']